jgi:hypothetical protein
LLPRQSRPRHRNHHILHPTRLHPPVDVPRAPSGVLAPRPR